MHCGAHALATHPVTDETQYGNYIITNRVQGIFNCMSAMPGAPPAPRIRMIVCLYVVLAAGFQMHSCFASEQHLSMGPRDAVVGFERSVYYRERAAAMYSSMPYSAAQAIVEVRQSFVL